MSDPVTQRFDFGALLPGVGDFGGVRRFLEIGNALVRRGHRFVLYHPDGSRPAWLPFACDVRRLDDLGSLRHDVLLCGEPTLLERFETSAPEWRDRLVIFLFTSNVPALVDSAMFRRAGGQHVRLGGLARRGFAAVLEKQLRGRRLRTAGGVRVLAEELGAWVFSGADDPG